jgi:hypothetical protein
MRKVELERLYQTQHAWNRILQARVGNLEQQNKDLQAENSRLVDRSCSESLSAGRRVTWLVNRVRYLEGLIERYKHRLAKAQRKLANRLLENFRRRKQETPVESPPESLSKKLAVSDLESWRTRQGSNLRPSDSKSDALSS